MKVYRNHSRNLGYVLFLLGIATLYSFAQTNDSKRRTSEAVSVPRLNADTWQLRLKGVTSNGLTYIVYHDFQYYPTQEMVCAAEEASLAAVKILERYKQKRPVSEYGAILSLRHEWEVSAKFYSKREYPDWPEQRFVGIMGGAPDYFWLKFTIEIPETLEHYFQFY